MKDCMKSPRPFVQRIFFEWLETNHRQFNSPLKIVRRTDRIIEFNFIGLTPMLKGVLVRDWGITVYVEHEGEIWDAIADFGLVETCTEFGYTNKLYLPDAVQFSPDRHSLWVSEVFQQLLDWSNTSLAQANWLVLYGEKDHSTSAYLRSQCDPDALCFDIRLAKIIA
jgi:hypothetical protein